MSKIIQKQNGGYYVQTAKNRFTRVKSIYLILYPFLIDVMFLHLFLSHILYGFNQSESLSCFRKSTHAPLNN